MLIFRRLLISILIIIFLAAVAIAGWYLTHKDEARAYRQIALLADALELGHPYTKIARVGTDTPPAASTQTLNGLPARVIDSREGKSSEKSATNIAILLPPEMSDSEIAELDSVQRALARGGITSWIIRLPFSYKKLPTARQQSQVIGALAQIEPNVSVIALGSHASTILAHAARNGKGSLRSVLAVQPIADRETIIDHALSKTELAVDPALLARSNIVNRLLAPVELMSVASDIPNNMLIVALERNSAYPAADAQKLAIVAPKNRTKALSLPIDDSITQLDRDDQRAIARELAWWLQTATS